MKNDKTDTVTNQRLSLEQLITICSNAYPDGQVRLVWEEFKSRPGIEQISNIVGGDTLAAFVALEASDMMVGGPSDLEALRETAIALQRASWDLAKVVDHLNHVVVVVTARDFMRWVLSAKVKQTINRELLDAWVMINAPGSSKDEEYLDKCFAAHGADWWLDKIDEDAPWPVMSREQAEKVLESLEKEFNLLIAEPTPPGTPAEVAAAPAPVEPAS